MIQALAAAACFKRLGSRKVMIAPDGSDAWPSRAHRWKWMLEGGMIVAESPSVDRPAPRLRIGDHLVSTRRFISHHGIYVGNGQVIHYAGLASGLQAGPVKVSPLEDFLADHPYKVKEYKTRTYSREESVERARARIGGGSLSPGFQQLRALRNVVHYRENKKHAG